MTLLIETRQLEIALPETQVCNKLNLQIKPGEIWGILGANGSGKTTLLQTLARLRKPTRGEIWLRDKPLASYSSREIAQQIGFLFQQTNVAFSQSVLEFCLAGRHPHLSRFALERAGEKEIAQEALTRMDLLSKSQQKVHTLSGGEKQRLAIATLLTQQPQIYLLDEPTNHLDMLHQMKVMRHIKHLAAVNRAAVIMSLHDMNMAEYFCDRVLLLFGKGETLQGKSSALLTEENLTRLFGHFVQKTVTQEGRIWTPSFAQQADY